MKHATSYLGVGAIYSPREILNTPVGIKNTMENGSLTFHLYLLRKACSFPFVTGSPPILQSLLAVVVLVQESSTKEFVGRSNSLRTKKLRKRFEAIWELHKGINRAYLYSRAEVRYWNISAAP